MNEFDAPKELRKFRPMLLACEAIGWLHMAGKARKVFLDDPENNSGKNWYQEINDFMGYFAWLDRLLDQAYDTWKLPGKPPGREKLIKTMLEEFSKKPAKNIVGFIQAGHAMASGIEKNLPKNTSAYLGQDATHMWRSSAFGNPERNLLADPPRVITNTGWTDLLSEITSILESLEQLGKNEAKDACCWWDWREKAIGAESFLRKAFTSTIAETRLPNNDVTLWDQSYVAAALFKSALAGALIEKKKFPWKNVNLKTDTHWRLLTIGIGTDHYESRAVKIGDWSGSKLAIDNFFEEIRCLIEADLSIGSLLYADSSVQVFSFPCELNTGIDIDKWLKYMQNEADKLADKYKFETPPYCNISEPSRSLVHMTKEIEKARETLSVSLHRNWNISDTATFKGHVCPVCLMRKNGDKTKKKTPCKPCKERREHRLAHWLNGKTTENSIWITELADTNDRVALVTMSLDIEPWLDGTRLDFIRAQAISEWRLHNPDLIEFWERDETKRKFETNPILQNDVFNSLVKEIENRIIIGFNKDDLLLSNLQEGYRYAEDLPSFFKSIVEDRFESISEDSSDDPKWDDLDDEKRARWFAHQFFRKLPSPGRIYRFQRQTQDFFERLLSGFRKTTANIEAPWRTKRLFLKPKNIDNRWQHHQPYNGNYNDSPVDLLFDKKADGFITITNLARLIKKDESQNALEGKTIPLKNDDNQAVDPLEIESAEVLKNLGVYHPVIPLELSPVRFRVLLPLEAASECVDQAIEAWNEEFSRVWDRLPLRIGVVAFPRKTPFQAVLEATRNLEDRLGKSEKVEKWKVEDNTVQNGDATLRLSPSDDERARSETKTIPITLPDGREDVFYPYFAVQGDDVRSSLDFKHPEGQVYRHAKDLKPGDVINVHPARVATVYLDDTAARFDIDPPKYLADWSRMRELWEQVKRIAPSQTALKGAWGELTAKREEWKDPEDGDWADGGKDAWLEYAKAVFANRLDAEGADLDTLTSAAGDGLLKFCLDWNLRVLKQKISEDES